MVPLRADPSPPAGVRYLQDLSAVVGLSARERRLLEPVAEHFPFRATDYYLDLIDWNDPDDPLRRIIVPQAEELFTWGSLDASDEAAITVRPGVQHKYPHTVLLLCNHACAGYCRYCFRKRIFLHDDEVVEDVSEGIAYIAARPEVTNVLLTGGDPLLLPTRRLADIWHRLRQIPHVGVIRIGTRVPAYDPWRILRDPALLEALASYSTAERRIYVMTHFDHPRELTAVAVRSVDALIRAGAVCANQNPLVRGVNDDPATLAELFRRLSFIGAAPYYLFQVRPTQGNRSFTVPLVEAYRIFEEAKRRVSGLAKRARFVLSHATGKVEVLWVDDRYIHMRYHRAMDRERDGELMTFLRDDEAGWLDELVPAAGAVPGARPVGAEADDVGPE
jgi:lysine 2,3-aminomutase